MKLTQEQMEKMAKESAENFGAPDKLLLHDPVTDELVLFDMHDPSDRAMELFKRLYDNNDWDKYEKK